LFAAATPKQQQRVVNAAPTVLSNNKKNRTSASPPPVPVKVVLPPDDQAWASTLEHLAQTGTAFDGCTALRRSNGHTTHTETVLLRGVNEGGVREGDKVEAKCTGWTKYYKGEITRVNSDDTYDITFEDGERKRGVRNEQSGQRGGKRGVNGGGKAGGKGGVTGKGGVVTGKERIVVTAKSQLSFQRVTPQEASTFLLQVLGEPALGTRAQQSTHLFGLYVVDGTGDGGDGGGGSGGGSGAKTGVKPGGPKSKQHTSSTATKTPPLNLIECEFYDSDDETTVLTVVGQKGASIQTTGGVHTEWGKCLSTSLVLG
jgi:hypothetical protein